MSGRAVKTDAELRSVVEEALEDAIELFELPSSLRRLRGKPSGQHILEEVVGTLGSMAQTISGSDATAPEEDFAVATALLLLSRLYDALYPTSSDLTGKER